MIIMLMSSGGNIGGKPYDALTGWLEAHTKLSKPDAALEPGCKARNPQAPWLCLYVNETLPFVTTPIYLVNQMASIWDTFCNIDGVETDDALQISCTPHGDFAIMEWHYCFQYVNHGRAADHVLTPTRKSGHLCFGALRPPKQGTPGANGTNLDTPGHARVRSTTYVTPRQLFGKKTSKPLHDRDRFSRAAVDAGSNRWRSASSRGRCGRSARAA